MKKYFPLLMLLLFGRVAMANINFIEISKITVDPKLVQAFNYIKENQQYYDHYSPEWTYETPKEEFVKRLRLYFSGFNAIGAKNAETHMLIGDIGHYLYNLDDTLFHKPTLYNYHAAIKVAPTDYRPYWFLGYHYAMSNVPGHALDNFTNAETILPAEVPVEFWEEYATGMGYINMPSLSINAMEKVKAMKGGVAGDYETQMGEEIRKRLLPLEKDKPYAKEAIWFTGSGKKVSYTSRALGLKVIADTLWFVNISDFEKRAGFFILTPPDIKTASGKEIDWSITVFVKVAGDKETMDMYLRSLNQLSPTKVKVAFSDKYPKSVAYEMKDNNSCTDAGGAHSYLIGIERDAPAVPGYLLEKPYVYKFTRPLEASYYTATETHDRFKGRIFYAVKMEVCEEGHEQALTQFKELFDKQIIIE